MSYENFPESKPLEKEPHSRGNKGRNILTIILVVALLATWGYIIYAKKNNRLNQENLTAQVTSGDSARSELQTELNDAVWRLDGLKTANARADSLINTKGQDIQQLKNKIQAILKDKYATEEQLNEARRLIAQFKGNIETYAAEIDSLKTMNTQLTVTNQLISQQRDSVRKDLDTATRVIQQKDQVIDVGSTLSASHFEITGIQEKNSGREKETSKAKRVDKLRISFMIDANRITASGTKDLYICITGPDGQPVAVDALGSGRFVTRDGVERPFTKKLKIDYIQGKKQPVSIEWSQSKNFQAGDYKIEIYNNGFKVGEGITHLRKGGLFG